MVTKKSYNSATDSVMIGALSLGSLPNREHNGPQGKPGPGVSALRYKRLRWRLECRLKSCPTSYSRALMSPPSQRTSPFFSGAYSLRGLSTSLASSDKQWAVFILRVTSHFLPW
ncbi:hypothetical protein AHAS_Ahas11G0146700 [Arachis hypogaea]